MKKQQKYKGLSQREVEFLQRQNRKDFVEMLTGILLLAVIIAFAVTFTIGALAQ